MDWAERGHKEWCGPRGREGGPRGRGQRTLMATRRPLARWRWRETTDDAPRPRRRTSSNSCCGRTQGERVRPRGGPFDVPLLGRCLCAADRRRTCGNALCAPGFAPSPGAEAPVHSLRGTSGVGGGSRSALCRRQRTWSRRSPRRDHGGGRAWPAARGGTPSRSRGEINCHFRYLATSSGMSSRKRPRAGEGAPSAGGQQRRIFNMLESLPDEAEVAPPPAHTPLRRIPGPVGEMFGARTPSSETPSTVPRVCPETPAAAQPRCVAAFDMDAIAFQPPRSLPRRFFGS